MGQCQVARIEDNKQMMYKKVLNRSYDVEFYLIDAFEIYHFYPLYKFLEDKGINCCFVVEPNKTNSSKKWFDYSTALRIIKQQGVKYKSRPNYNSLFAITTQDERLIHNYRHKKVNLNYGYSLMNGVFLETAESIKGFDLMLVHGESSRRIVSEIDSSIKTIIVGYPRYSQWGEGRKYLYDAEKRISDIKRLNKENKPILMYFPTWDAKSSIDSCADLLKQYRNEFFIVTKAHHCTYRLPREQYHLEKLREISDVLLEGNFPFQEAAGIGDLAIIDALSGASTEVPYINPNIRLLLMYSHMEEFNNGKDFIEDFAICVKNEQDLYNSLERLRFKDPNREKRVELIKEIYSDNVEAGLEELCEYIEAYKKGKANK